MSFYNPSPQSLIPDPNDTFAVFDELSAIYENARNRGFYTGIARRMAERAHDFDNLADGSCCLDLACGTGISTEAAVAVVPDVDWFGLDGSAKMLHIARTKKSLDAVQFTQSAAENTPFWDQAFDWILCSVAYHWLPPSTVDEIKRLLKPGGRLSMMVPLVAPAGNEEGNLWLGRILMKFSRTITSRRSQGLTLATLKWELRDFHLDRGEIIDIDEEFMSFRELLDTLNSRSSFSAIFGAHAPEVKNQLAAEDYSAPHRVRFRWKIGFVEARLR
jgi:ubiquinone/menaquinone biosynthesis C-methylase UbiE